MFGISLIRIEASIHPQHIVLSTATAVVVSADVAVRRAGLAVPTARAVRVRRAFASLL